jgi:serine/threonine protein kinase
MRTSYIPKDEIERILSERVWLNRGKHMSCTACTAKVPEHAAYCGVCGARTGKRDSLTGMMFDGRFRVGAKIASGGFGSIYRARDASTNAPVALKVLHADLASDATLAARFRREAAVLASLRDPHTVATYEHGEAAGGTHYIVMELLTGRSLQAELRAEGPLPWWRMLAIMRGVCSSLMEAHALGIVHRDLKPANIHLEQRSGKPDFVKVLDFGIVKVLGGSNLDDESHITRAGQAVGTVDYMSPEQIIGGEIDRRTDLYTLGVVAYEMITGRRPFADATTAPSLMTALMTRTPMPPSVLFHKDCFPPAVDHLILRCLARDPQDRFADAAELADAIDDILTHRSPAAFAPIATLTGYRVPRRPSRPADRAVDGAMAAATYDPDVTTVDVVPLFDPSWEPGPEQSAPRLARVPHLDTPPEPPRFKAARGSTVTVTPVRPLPVPRPARTGMLRLAAWAAVLLAGGIGLGALVASLA